MLQLRTAAVEANSGCFVLLKRVSMGRLSMLFRHAEEVEYVSSRHTEL